MQRLFFACILLAALCQSCVTGFFVDDVYEKDFTMSPTRNGFNVRRVADTSVYVSEAVKEKLSRAQLAEAIRTARSRAVEHVGEISSEVRVFIGADVCERDILFTYDIDGFVRYSTRYGPRATIAVEYKPEHFQKVLNHEYVQLALFEQRLELDLWLEEALSNVIGSEDGWWVDHYVRVVTSVSDPPEPGSLSDASMQDMYAFGWAYVYWLHKQRGWSIERLVKTARSNPLAIVEAIETQAAVHYVAQVLADSRS